MKNGKEYFAFISYKSEDEKWAKWLANKLENYKLPSTLNGKELPKSLRKTFRDIDELSAGNLPEQIYKALSKSDNLIVVCSPRVAGSKSEWVNKEIEEFIQLKGGKSDKIFPFIIEGEPFSKEEEKDCFPDALRNLKVGDERLGGNVNKQGGRDAAVVKVVAGMLGVTFDSLWNRYEREQKRKRRLWVTVALVMAFIGIGIAGWMWSMNKQLKEKNRNLSIENIRMASKEIENLIDQGDYPSANDVLDDIMTIWADDFIQEDAPEFERALRKMFRYVNDNGLVKLYDISLSNKQHYLFADSNFVYVSDYELSTPRLLRYYIRSGRFDKQVDLQLVDSTNILFCGLKDNLLVYKRPLSGKEVEFRVYNMETHADFPFLRDSIPFRFVGIQPQGRLLMYQEPDVWSPLMDFPSDKLLKIFKLNNNGLKEECKMMVPIMSDEPTIVGDTIFTLNGTHLYAYRIPEGELICDYDYKRYDASFSGVANTTKVDPESKWFASSGTGYDLASFCANYLDSVNIGKMHGSGEICISHNLVAATKHDYPDSLFIYAANKDIGTPLLSAKDEGIGYHDLSFAGDRYLLASSHNSIKVFNYSMQFETKGLYAPNGNFYVGEDSRTGLPAVINEQTDSVLCSLLFPDDHIRNIFSFSPKSNYLLCQTYGSPFCVIDLNTAKMKKIAIKPSKPNFDVSIKGISMSADERIVSVLFGEHGLGFSQQSDNRLIVYDVKKDSILIDQVFTESSGSFWKYLPEDIFAVSVNYDGSKIAFKTLSDISYIHLPLLKGQNQAELIDHVPNVSPISMAFGHCKDTLTVSYSDGSIRFWDLKSGQQVFKTIKSGKVSMNFDVSQDFQYLIESVSSDGLTGEYMVWHIPSGNLVDHFESKEMNLLRKVYTHFEGDRFFFTYYDVAFAQDDPSCIIINDFNRLMSVKSEFPSFQYLLKWAKE